jgi:hypothetical protein
MMRMRALVAAAALYAVFTPLSNAEFYNCYSRITPNSDLSIVTVIGRCSFVTSGTINQAVNLRGEMSVAPSGVNTACFGAGYCGMSMKPPYVASTHYVSQGKYVASQASMPFDEIAIGDAADTPDPIRPHSTCPGCCEYSPLIISLRGDYQLTSVSDGVLFDIDADGTMDRVSWTAAGSELAFLALDRNRNGRIDGGAELFGDVAADNGWLALAMLDANGDGTLNELDPAWNDLALWTDRDHNGLSSPEELLAVNSSVVHAIATTHRWVGRRDAFGNMLRYAGEVTLTSGRRTAYDVYFLGK